MTGGEDGVINHFRLVSGKMKVLKSHKIGQRIVKIQKYKDKLVVLKGNSDFDYNSSRQFEIWDLHLKNKIASRTLKKEIWSLCCGNDKVFFGLESGKISCFDLENDLFVDEYITHETTVSALKAVGSSLIFGDDSGTLCSLDEDLKLKKGKKGSAFILCINTEFPRKVVTGSSDGIIRVWKTSNLGLVSYFKAHSDWIREVKRWNEFIVSCSDSEKIVVSNSEGKAVHQLLGHQNWVFSITVLQNRLVSVADDGTTRLWDLEQGKVLQLIKVHKDSVLSLCSY